MYGEDVLTVRQCHNWFTKLRSANFDIENALRSGRPIEADTDPKHALIDGKGWISTSEISERLNLSNSTINDQEKPT